MSRVGIWGRGSGHGGSHVYKQLVIVFVSRSIPTYINSNYVYTSGRPWGWGGMGDEQIGIWGRGSGHGGSHVHKQLIIVCVCRGAPTYINNW